MIMTKAWLKYLILIVGIAALGSITSYGCGGSSGDGLDEFAGANPINISMSADMSGFYIDADGNLAVKDASGGTTGSGDSGDGIDSITDSFDMTCDFVVEFVDGGDDDNVEFVSGDGYDSSNCTGSLNQCIYCDIGANDSAEPSTCDVSCSGWVPSTAAVDNDTLTIKFVYTAVATTTMPAPDGAIVFDLAMGSPWGDMDLLDASADVSYDVTGCNASDVNELDVADSFVSNGAINTQILAEHTFDITGVNASDPADDCTIIGTIEQEYKFDGSGQSDHGTASDGDLSLDLTGDNITVDGTLYDDAP